MTNAHDLIKRLADAAAALASRIDGYYEPALVKEMAVIEEARAYLATSGWIKCSEQMPPMDTDVLWYRPGVVGGNPIVGFIDEGDPRAGIFTADGRYPQEPYSLWQHLPVGPEDAP